MPTQKTTIPSLLLGPADPSWGDERERGILLEAYAYAYLLGAFLHWVILAVVAWFIPAWVGAIFFVALLIPAMEFQRYSKARGADTNLLTYGHGSRTRLVITAVVTCACAISAMLAITSSWSGGAAGGIVGGIVGASAAIYFSKRKARKTQAKLDAEANFDEPA